MHDSSWKPCPWLSELVPATAWTMASAKRLATRALAAPGSTLCVSLESAVTPDLKRLTPRGVRGRIADFDVLYTRHHVALGAEVRLSVYPAVFRRASAAFVSDPVGLLVRTVLDEESTTRLPSTFSHYRQGDCQVIGPLNVWEP